MTRKKVIWSNYQPLLDFADELRQRLDKRGHAPTNLIDVHSYIYILGSEVLPNLADSDDDTHPAWSSILAARKSRAIGAAKRREEIGLQGEQWVYKKEKERLHEAGRPDLAIQVRYVAEESVGYDVASFRSNGEPLHIEVKTTRQNVNHQFWLTNNEYAAAQRDKNAWTVYRVMLPHESKPQIEDIGNVVISDDWCLEPDGYVVRGVTQ